MASAAATRLAIAGGMLRGGAIASSTLSCGNWRTGASESSCSNGRGGGAQAASASRPRSITSMAPHSRAHVAITPSRQQEHQDDQVGHVRL